MAIEFGAGFKACCEKDARVACEKWLMLDPDIR